jgi:G:T-mismatch repair DNA endonuclease (very short patch repair protein)
MGHYVSPESKEKNRLAHIGKAGHLAKYAFKKGNVPYDKGISRPATTREKESRTKKEQFAANPALSQRMREQRLNQPPMPHENTSINRKVRQQLTDAGIVFESEKKLLGITKVDVFIPPNIVIYNDGDYWHSLPVTKRRDERNTLALDKAGYIVIHLSGHRIKQKDFDVMHYIGPLLQRLHS